MISMRRFYLSCLFLGHLSLPASAAMFHTIDTTSPLLCTFSYKFQNRVMVENGKIQKVIASDEDRLSIFTDPFSGQIFISTRDFSPQETTVSIVTESGVVQDLQISFIERSSEVVILTDPVSEKVSREEQPIIVKDNALDLVEEVIKGRIPQGYLPCQAECMKWSPKKGVLMESIVQFIERR